jgi:hypothetical protein
MLVLVFKEKRAKRKAAEAAFHTCQLMVTRKKDHGTDWQKWIIHG